MAEEEFLQLLKNVRDFDWNPNKREQVFRDRGIDFDDARHVLSGPHIVRRSDRRGEARYMVFGFLGDLEVVFVCTFRGELCWVITARRASRDERKKYHSHLPRPFTPAQVQE
ncbi:MAG: BrnT family toxin [Xanthobacteraceae bacterium]